MATSKRRNARHKESAVSIANPPLVSNEEMIFQTWQNEMQRDYQTVKKSLTTAKNVFLKEIDFLIKNTKPEVLNMTISDYRKAILRQNVEEETTKNKENNLETMTIENDEQESETHADVLSNVESLMTQTAEEALTDMPPKTATVRRAASKRKKKVNPKAAMKTPSHAMLSADWRSTPAFTPLLRSRWFNPADVEDVRLFIRSMIFRNAAATPLTAIRQPTASDYEGISFKFVAVNDRGSPIAPAEYQCPNLMKKLDRLAKDAGKAFESARKNIK